MATHGHEPAGKNPVPPLVQCGDLKFDFARRVLTRQDIPIDISGAYLNALFLLVERSPTAVPKAELTAAAGTTEETLYKVIETIRKAIGDTEEPRRLIVTERGIGYRFIGMPTLAVAPGSTPKSLIQAHPVARKLAVAAAIVCLAGILLGAAFLYYWPPRVPATASVEGSFLIARDASGKELWRHFFSHGLESVRYGPASIQDRYWIGDLSGSGKPELLFLQDSAIPGNIAVPIPQESSMLFCFTSTGKVKWSFEVGRTVRDSSTWMHPPYLADAMLVLSMPGSRTQHRIVVASGHHTDQAYQLAFLDAAGVVVAEYWHPGSLSLLRSLAAAPGSAPRLLAAGVDNGEHQATLVELDPWNLHGASTPVRMKDQRFRLLDMPDAREERVILFPRTCLSRNEPYTRVSALSVDEGGVHLQVFESYNPDPNRLLYYDFDRSLRLTRAFVSSNYRAEHLQLEESGRLHHSWREDEDGLSRGLEYRVQASLN